jgi:hypothetical protein
MKEEHINQSGLIQVPILIAIITGILILGGGYLGIRQYQGYQIGKIEKEEQLQSLLEAQQKVLEDAQLEIGSLKQQAETLKKKPAYVPISKEVDCSDISLDRFAPGYTPDDLQRFLDNAKDAMKNISTSDAKYVIDTYFASQWKSVNPECKTYIDNLVDSRRMANEQKEEIKKISDQQQKMIDYNQCLFSADRSTCQFLLY